MHRVLIVALVLGFYVDSASAQVTTPGSGTTVAPGPVIPDGSRPQSEPEHNLPPSNDGDETRQLPALPQTPTLPEEPASPVRPAR
jgi:hypothetical protein